MGMARSCKSKFLLEGIERSFKEPKEEQWDWSWKEKGRKYQMTKDRNHEGPFVCLKVTDTSWRNYSIYLPKGRDKERGWRKMAALLREMGVQTRPEPKKNNAMKKREEMGKKGKDLRSKGIDKSYDEILKQPLPVEEEVCVKVEGKECEFIRGQLDCCLVGSWTMMESFLLDPVEGGKKMSKKWGLKDFLGMTKMGEGKFLLEFALKREAARVLQKGERKFLSFNIDLRWWGLSEGCISSSTSMKELWVRLVGLPAHLWETQTLERLGDTCVGLIAVDKPAKALADL